jgi:hypothetical protein
MPAPAAIAIGCCSALTVTSGRRAGDARERLHATGIQRAQAADPKRGDPDGEGSGRARKREQQQGERAARHGRGSLTYDPSDTNV